MVERDVRSETGAYGSVAGDPEGNRNTERGRLSERRECKTTWKKTRCEEFCEGLQTKRIGLVKGSPRGGGRKLMGSGDVEDQLAHDQSTPKITGSLGDVRNGGSVGKRLSDVPGELLPVVSKSVLDAGDCWRAQVDSRDCWQTKSTSPG
ncbi:hypothetical protein C8F04DRAFT_1177703 [Mycena alexandri]|uniref:Uncharacterized protein n=1 Tax=Mycena alexandri TaxID=1745969 RepID=A0AAD6XAC6_9AGAR|nr:hypothetical protein C8F04DRAFT_1177703 [Mycena alexandri]